MSTFQTTTDTIDLICRGLLKYRLARHADIDIIGQDLRRQNIHAINVSYPDGDHMDVAFPEYERTPFDRKVKRAAIDGATRCWIYQCSEFPEFTESNAYKLVERMRAKNAALMGFDDLDGDDYGQQATGNPFWDITDREAVMVRPRAERVAEAEAEMRERRQIEVDTAAINDAYTIAINDAYTDDEDDADWDEEG